MPSRETVERFVAQVMTEDHVAAIRDWYADDASMQENSDPPRGGRATLMASEQKVMARMASVRTELLAPPIVDGDQVAIQWRFTFTGKDGSIRSMEEVAWQLWRGDKIWRERFLYDPAQMKD